jgi:hypothetical protein
MVHAAETREAARGELIERWDRSGRPPRRQRIILTHTNDEVRELNERRATDADSGELGDDVHEPNAASAICQRRPHHVPAQRAQLGVKNGTLGTIEQVTPQRMAVRTDDGRSVAFDTKDYAHIDHGYAATIHKAQGMTVDRAHVLATPGMDSHGAYVAMSRHRDGLELHYGRDDFADQSKLVRTLSRERGKDMASDYKPEQKFAERRGITFRERIVQIARQLPERAKSIFAGFRPQANRSTLPTDQAGRGPINAGRRTLRTCCRTTSDKCANRIAEPRHISTTRWIEAGKALDVRSRPNGVADLASALQRQPSLAREPLTVAVRVQPRHAARSRNPRRSDAARRPLCQRLAASSASTASNAARWRQQGRAEAHQPRRTWRRG